MLYKYHVEQLVLVHSSPTSFLFFRFKIILKVLEKSRFKPIIFLVEQMKKPSDLKIFPISFFAAPLYLDDLYCSLSWRLKK